MHELLLLTPAPLPASRHHQLLSILSGLSGMQPIPISQSQLLFLPNKRPRDPAEVLEKKVGGSQDVKVEKRRREDGEGGLWALSVKGERAEEDEENEQGFSFVSGGKVGIDKESSDGKGKETSDQVKGIDTGGERIKWTLQQRDLPEVVRGERQVTSRGTSDVEIETEDPVTFMEGMEYSFHSSHYLIGHRLTHNHISILLYRIHLPQTPPTQPLSSQASQVSLPHVPPSSSLLPLPFPSPSTATTQPLLDPSGSYLLTASLLLPSDPPVPLLKRGADELLQFKETLKGVVDLEPGDRLAMDGRVMFRRGRGETVGGQVW